MNYRKLLAVSLAGLMLTGCGPKKETAEEKAAYYAAYPADLYENAQNAVMKVSDYTNGASMVIGKTEDGISVLHLMMEGLDYESYEYEGKTYIYFKMVEGEEVEEASGWLNSETEDEEGITGLENPMVMYDSLSEINEEAGVNLASPAASSVSDIHYAVITAEETKIAEYEFELNNVIYIFRAADSKDDISGLYTGDGTIFENEKGDAYICDGEYAVCRWFNEYGQYVLNADGDVDEAEFKAVTDELKELTASENTETTEVPVFTYVETLEEGMDVCTYDNGDGTESKVYFDSALPHKMLKVESGETTIEYVYSGITIPEELKNSEEMSEEDAFTYMFISFMKFGVYSFDE